MSQADVIQVDYDALQRIAASFGRAAATQRETRERISSATRAASWTWRGRGSEQFFLTVNLAILPRLRRVEEALEEAERVLREILVIYAKAEIEAAKPFHSRGLICLPPIDWEPSSFIKVPPNPLGWTGARWDEFRELYENPEKVAIFLVELEKKLSREAAHLLTQFDDWVKLWGRDPYRAIRIGIRVGRVIPRGGDYFTLIAGGLDVMETLWQNRYEYVEGSAARGMAAMYVDTALALLPAVAELGGGSLGLAAGAAFGAYVLGGGGAVAGSAAGPGGSGAGGVTGLAVGTATFALLGDSLGGELGLRFGLDVQLWARSEGRRERAIDIVESSIRFWRVVPSNASWNLHPSTEREP